MSTSAPAAPLLGTITPQGPTLYGYHTYQKLVNGKIRTTQTAYRSPNGELLPHVPTKAILRTFRSKYKPHFGAKQRRKLDFLLSH